MNLPFATAIVVFAVGWVLTTSAAAPETRRAFYLISLAQLITAIAAVLIYHTARFL